MSSGNPPQKPPAKTSRPAGSPPGSGEGAQSALAAMIKKRQMRAQQDEPTPVIPVVPPTHKAQPMPAQPADGAPKKPGD